MVWDTKSQQIVGNNVYDLNALPKENTAVKLDEVKAVYVANP